MVNRIFFGLVAILFMIYVYKQVKKDRLSEKESFFWITGSVVILILGCFPQIIGVVSELLHIEYPPSLLFLLGIIFVLGLVFRVMIYITLLKEQSKELAQRYALLEKRVSEIENIKNT